MKDNCSQYQIILQYSQNSKYINISRLTLVKEIIRISQDLFEINKSYESIKLSVRGKDITNFINSPILDILTQHNSKEINISISDQILHRSNSRQSNNNYKIPLNESQTKYSTDYIPTKDLNRSILIQKSQGLISDSKQILSQNKALNSRKNESGFLNEKVNDIVIDNSFNKYKRNNILDSEMKKKVAHSRNISIEKALNNSKTNISKNPQISNEIQIISLLFSLKDYVSKFQPDYEKFIDSINIIANEIYRLNSINVNDVANKNEVLSQSILCQNEQIDYFKNENMNLKSQNKELLEKLEENNNNAFKVKITEEEILMKTLEIKKLNDKITSLNFVVENQEKNLKEFEKTVNELQRKNEEIKQEKELKQKELFEANNAIKDLKNHSNKILENYDFELLKAKNQNQESGEKINKFNNEYKKILLKFKEANCKFQSAFGIHNLIYKNLEDYNFKEGQLVNAIDCEINSYQRLINLLVKTFYDKDKKIESLNLVINNLNVIIERIRVNDTSRSNLNVNDYHLVQIKNENLQLKEKISKLEFEQRKEKEISHLNYENELSNLKHLVIQKDEEIKTLKGLIELLKADIYILRRSEECKIKFKNVIQNSTNLCFRGKSGENILIENNEKPFYTKNIDNKYQEWLNQHQNFIKNSERNYNEFKDINNNISSNDNLRLKSKKVNEHISNKENLKEPNPLVDYHLNLDFLRKEPLEEIGPQRKIQMNKENYIKVYDEIASDFQNFTHRTKDNKDAPENNLYQTEKSITNSPAQKYSNNYNSPLKSQRKNKSNKLDESQNLNNIENNEKNPYNYPVIMTTPSQYYDQSLMGDSPSKKKGKKLKKGAVIENSPNIIVEIQPESKGGIDVFRNKFDKNKRENNKITLTKNPLNENKQSNDQNEKTLNNTTIPSFEKKIGEGQPQKSIQLKSSKQKKDNITNIPRQMKKDRNEFDNSDNFSNISNNNVEKEQTQPPKIPTDLIETKQETIEKKNSEVEKSKLKSNSVVLSEKSNKDANLDNSEIFDESFEANHTKRVRIRDGIKVLLTVFDSKHILKYFIEDNQFKLLEFADFGEFEKNYFPQGSIQMNIKDGLLIITGENHDIFYIYHLKKNSMFKICHLNNNHSYGGMVLFEETNTIICLSGWFNKTVEKYSSMDYKYNFLPVGKSPIFNEKEPKHWVSMPDLNIERSECPYVILDKYKLFSFFGFNCPTLNYTDTIEMMDLRLQDQWKLVEYKNNSKTFSTFRKSHSLIRLNDTDVLFVGGFDGLNSIPVEKYSFFSSSDLVVKDEDQNFPEIENNHVYNFQKSMNFFPFIDHSKSLQLINFDETESVHCLDLKSMKYDFFKFQD